MTTARILIVEDDWFIASLLESILTRADYEVVLAKDGQAGLDRLEKDPDFDTILLDRRMPGIDGLKVLRHLKQTEHLQDIPVVLETGMDSEDQIREGLEAGALYYLVKPLDPKLVLQVVAAAAREFETKKRLWAEMEGTRSALGLIQRGVFHFQTLHQCHDLAALLAKAWPDPKRAVIGLSELMINALEHGNLGITYDEKSSLIEAEAWEAEVVRRQKLPVHEGKRVTVSLVRSATRTRVRIQDMGKGFRWADFEEPNPERMFDSHGRGILLAKWETFDRVEYQGVGNCVVAEIDHA